MLTLYTGEGESEFAYATFLGCMYISEVSCGWNCEEVLLKWHC